MYGFDRLLDGAEKGKPQQRNDYVGNAEWVIHESQARGARVLLWTSLLAVALLLLWAGFGSIDEVVRGEGKVVPSRQVQIIQSLDGGIVEEILVKPGQEVEAGQILLKIDSTRFASSLGENNAEYLSLLAKSARLKALATGEPFVAPEEVLKQAPNLIEMERNAWQARTSELNATVNVAREQLKQRQEELRETIAKRDQASASCGLTSRELQVTRPLLKSGAVSEVDLLRLQRDVARYCGEQKGAEAQIDRIQASIKEAQSKLEESELNIRNQARNELSETNTKLSTLREGKLALADRVKLAEVRAGARHRQDPVQQHGRRRGAAGQGHHRDRAQGRHAAAGSAHPAARHRFPACRPEGRGEIHRLRLRHLWRAGRQGRADRRRHGDGRERQFVLRGAGPHRSQHRGDKNLPIIPGMVAEVHILTGKRTVLQYLLKPVLRAKANAFTER